MENSNGTSPRQEIETNQKAHQGQHDARTQGKEEKEEKTIVLACGGPSLSETDWDSLPFPVAAINKAIWVAPRFEYWFIADGYPERAYKECWLPVAKNPGIAKCVPRNRVGKGCRLLCKVGRNIHAIQVSPGRNQDDKMIKRGRSMLDGKQPLFFIENKTTLFATQWLAMGFNRLIYVGCELDFTGNVASCTGAAMTTSEIRQMTKNLDMAKRGMMVLNGAAKQHGIKMLSFSPGSINDFLPRYIP